VFLHTEIANKTAFVVSSDNRDEVTICSHTNRTCLHRQTKIYFIYQNDTQVNKNCKYNASNRRGNLNTKCRLLARRVYVYWPRIIV